MNQLLSRDEYYAKRGDIPADVCVLCSMEQVVIATAKHWDWVAALAPYWKYQTMLVPKRHIAKVSDLSAEEMGEFLELHDQIVASYRDAEITFKDGTKLQNVLIFWRHRYTLYNDAINANNIDHLHIHFACDREHFLDPITEADAASWNPKIFEGKLFAE